MDRRPERNDFNNYMIPMFSPAGFIPVKGKGSILFDQQGKDYIDFAAGIAVNALGHANSELINSVTQQMHRVWHLGNGYTNEPVLTLARELVNATFADKVFFCNSGAEANEAALKLARKYASDHYDAGKNEIIAFNGSFHGRTLFTVSAGGQPKYSKNFGPLPGGIRHVPFNNTDAAVQAISSKTCAVIVEPVQGEGGVIPANKDFLTALRKACDEHDAVLIFDEVQTGVGRTGKLYAYMNYGVVPDILSTAKGLGGGFPIGGILTTNKLSPSLSAGTHGTTYGGNPLAATAAGTVLSTINDEMFLNNIDDTHDRFVKCLTEYNDKYQVFKEIRGMGLLLGCELNENYQGMAKQLSNLCAKHGLIVLIAGPNVVRFAPALNISPEEVEKGLMRFVLALEDFLIREE